MIGGVADRFADVLGAALLDPQQAGDAPVLGLAGALAGVLEAKQLGEMVLGCGAVQLQGAGLQRTAFLAEKTFAEAVGDGTDGEFEIDTGRGGGIAPGAQIVDAAGAVALEKSGAYRRDESTFASLVGAGEQIQAGFQIGDFEWLAELFELLDTDTGQLHDVAPARRSSRMPASRASASRARSTSLPS